MKNIRIKGYKFWICLLLLFGVAICTNSNAYAYQFNGYKLSNPKNVGVYCNAVDLSSMIYMYAKKWNDCSEIYLYTSYSAAANIQVSVSSSSTENYAVTYHFGNDNHSITFYQLWQLASPEVQNETIVHEFGHASGLAHTQSSNDSNSVMRQYGFNNKAYPLSDDKSGISVLY